jgi:hypothetical protein
VENAVSPKVKAAAVTGKRYPAQPDPLESPSKRSYSGVPRGRTQNVEEEPHSGSQMSQSVRTLCDRVLRKIDILP